MVQLMLNESVKNMKPSATLAMAALSRNLMEDGVDIVDLSAGEPDFDTPKIIMEVGKAAIDAGKTHYNPIRGTKAMIAALREKFKRDQGVSYEANEVMCTVGAKAAIHKALKAVIEEGDEVIIFAPYWVSYVEQIRLCGGKVVVVNCSASNNFMPTKEQLLNAITAKTKAVILNSPNNPSGSVISKGQLNGIAEALVKTPIWLISDEIYEKLVYDDAKHYSPSALSDDMRKRTIVVSGASKGYAMTGWRVGFVAGDAQVISAMANLQGQDTTCLPEFIQDAAAFALWEGPEVRQQINEMKEAYRARRELGLAGFQTLLPKVKIIKPQGAFYIWADFNAYIGQKINNKEIIDDMDLGLRMLKEARVASVPGSPFGCPGFMRFSIASAMSDIERAIQRMSAWLNNG